MNGFVRNVLMKHTTISLGLFAIFAYYLWTCVRREIFYTFVAVVPAMLVFRKKLSEAEVLVAFLVAVAVNAIVYRAVEHFDGDRKKKSMPKKKKAAKKTAVKENFEDEDDSMSVKSDAEDDGKDPHMDLGSTWMNAYEKLSPDVVQNMRADTKELMSTQKELMQSLATMGPAVKEGMELLNSFKQYFGAGVMPAATGASPNAM